MARPLSVLHVSSARTWRGGEQQLAYLFEQLEATRGIRQAIACAGGSELERTCRELGYRHVPVTRRGAVDPLFARGVARAAAGLGAEIVHAHDPHAHTASVLARALFRCQGPIAIHRRVDFGIKRDPFTRWKYDHPSVRRIVCVSEAIARILRPAIRDPARLRVVHDGVDLARFAGVAADGRLRREYGVPAGVPMIGNVSALADHKDYPTFVEVAARLTARGVDARFFAVGEGEERPAIEAAIRARGLGERVFLTGFRSDVPALLAELDVLLFPSKTEGLGSTVLDAFASGVPVVATTAGGIPELVVDGECGLLAPVRDDAGLAERVERVLRELGLRARLVEGGRRRVERFSIRRMADEMGSVYEELLGGGQAAATSAS